MLLVTGEMQYEQNVFNDKNHQFFTNTLVDNISFKHISQE